MITYIQSILSEYTLVKLRSVLEKSNSWENLRIGQNPPYMLELCGKEKYWAREFLFSELSLADRYRLKKSASSCVDYEVTDFHTSNLNFFKYEVGAGLGVHEDVRPPGELEEGMDFVSLIFYINDDYEGGKFRTYPNGQEVYTLELMPRAGDAVLMNNTIRHESTATTRGNKYIAVMHWHYRFNVEVPHIEFLTN